MHTFHNITVQADLGQTSSNMSSETYWNRLIQKQWLPKIENVCNKWDEKFPNTHCYVNNIEIEVSLDDLDMELLQYKILYQFQQQLEFINPKIPSKILKDKDIVIKKAPSIFEAFKYYLNYGIVPNYVAIKELRQWLFDTKKLTQQEQQVIQNIIINNHKATIRLISLQNIEPYKRVLKLIGLEQYIIDYKLQIEEKFITEFLIILEEQLLQIIAPIPKRIWKISLKEANSIHQFVNTLRLLIQAKNKSVVFQINDSQVEALEILVFRAIVQYNFKKRISLVFKNVITIVEDNVENKLKKIIEKENISTSKSEVESNIEQAVYKEQTLEHKLQNEQTLLKEKNEIDKILKQHYITTEKAGLILIHPFLKELLFEIGVLTKEYKIKKPNKAALTLHYIVTGSQEFTNLDMAFEKLLLGIPLETIISKKTILSKDEIEIINTMLRAALQHWDVLKNSTITTLRDMFLKREGKISCEKNKIHITVEKKAQDILLQKLPWNISIIKLPWLSELILSKW